MSKQFKGKTEGHGYFRKNKAVKGLASGIALTAGFFATGATTFADEVVVDAPADAVVAEAPIENTAANFVEVKPESSEAHLAQIAETGQHVGVIEATIESSTFDAAVESAQSNGVVVVESTNPVIVETLGEGQANLNAQEVKVEKAEETAIEVAGILAENDQTIKDETLKEVEEATKTYTDNNKAAIEDAKKQAADVKAAVNAQTAANARIETAVDTVRTAGVVVDGPTSTTRPLSAEESIVKGLTDAANAQTSAIKIIEDAVESARTADPVTVVTVTGTIEATAADAVQKAEEQKKAIEAVVAENKKLKADSIKAHEDAVAANNKANEDGQKAMDAKNAAGQAAVDKQNAEAQAAVDKKNAEAQAAAEKANADQQANIAAIIARNEAGQAAVDKANAEGQAAVDKANAEGQAAVDAANAQAAAQQQNYDSIQENNKKVMEAVGLTWTGDFAKDEAAVKAWNEANAGTFEETSGTKTTGITATSNTTIERSGGTGFTSEIDSPYWLILNDGEPKFDGSNLVTRKHSKWSTLLTEKNGTAKYVIKDTSNGDVTVEIYDVQAGVGPNGVASPNQMTHFGSVVYMNPGGGIGIGVGALGNVSSTTSVGIEGGNVSSNVGATNLGNLYTVSYKVKVTSANGDVQYITFNDVDNGQVIKNLNGDSAINSGSGLSGSGSSLTGSSGNQTQGAIGQLGSHSAEWDYAGNTTFEHSNPANTNLVNIHGGIFGPSSVRELKSSYTVDPISIQFPGVNPSQAQTFTPGTFTPEKFTPEEVPTYTPTEFTPETYTPVTFTPETFVPNPDPVYKEPTYKSVTVKNVQVKANYDLVQAEVKTHPIKVATTVNPVKTNQKPTNVKGVVNADGVNINTALIPKGEQETWTFGGEALKAGRAHLLEVKRVDHFDAGTEINVSTLAENNPEFDFVYDKDTHTLTTTLKADELLKANIDLTVPYILPKGSADFKALNDNAHYRNDYTTTFKYAETTIRDENGKYVPSGDVIVRYFNMQGETIHPNVVDTEAGDVGSSYDTTDHKPQIIAHDGKLYELTPKVVGEENGKVIEGTKIIDYYYDLRPERENKGSVIVHYVNTEGEVIKATVVDELDRPVDWDYDTTDNKPATITTQDGRQYRITPQVIGTEKGKVVEGVTEITYVYDLISEPKRNVKEYKVTSNVVEVRTPAAPKPTKDVVDDKGNSIDGTSVLPGKLNYTTTHNYAPYATIKASKESIAKNFISVGDHLDEALDLNSLNEWTATASNGDDVTELLELHRVFSRDEIDARIDEIIKNSGISPVGEFYYWVAKDPESFYTNYVSKGLDVTYNYSMKIKESFTEGEITNAFDQIDFGNGYKGNIVKNILPLLEIKKDVRDKDGNSIDQNQGKEGIVGLGEEFSYHLEGWVIPTNRGYDVWEYRFVDVLQVSHDEYQDYKVYTKVDFTYDGKEYKAGDEIDFSAVTHYSYDAKTGLFELNFNKDFLESLTRDQEFGVDVELIVKRIAYGEVTNEYKLYVNGIELKSNVVKTVTPPPAVPEQPATPVAETPVTPATPTPAPAQASTPAKTLPNTGDTGTLMSVAGMVISTIGFAGIQRRRRVAK